MVFKIIVALSLAAAVNAGLLTSNGPPSHISIVQPGHGQYEDSYDPHPSYAFHYSVHDGHTGDVKSQYETRNGDAVKGEYSLIDADGFRRTVKYSADHHNGFNAVVHREPIGHGVAVHATPVEVAHHAAPIIAHSAHPIVYSAAPALHLSAAHSSQPVVRIPTHSQHY